MRGIWWELEISPRRVGIAHHLNLLASVQSRMVGDAHPTRDPDLQPPQTHMSQGRYKAVAKSWIWNKAVELRARKESDLIPGFGERIAQRQNAPAKDPPEIPRWHVSL